MRRRDFLPAVAAAPVLLAQAQAPPAGPPGGWFRSWRLRWFRPWQADAVARLNRFLHRRFSPQPRKGRIKQGVTGGVFGRLGTLDEQCREAARLGIKGYDLINTPEQWAILKKYGLTPTMYQPQPARASATD
jgi:hypothetical protein